jgi:hypothetical protein
MGTDYRPAYYTRQQDSTNMWRLECAKQIESHNETKNKLAELEKRVAAVCLLYGERGMSLAEMLRCQ